MLLSEDARGRIERAVRDAETRTSGEIACVVAEEASDYSEVPLIWAAVIALAAPSIPLTFLAVVITVRHAIQGWETTEWISAQSLVTVMAMLATVQIGLFALVTLLALIPGFRRFLTPRGLKRRYVRERAMEQFRGKGLADTSDHAGVLIYASMKDRCAELIADKGIDSKVEPGAWQRIVANLTSQIRAGNAADGFVAAVRDCGDRLAEHFPAGSSNPNEVPDRVAELPRGSRSS